MEAEIVLPTRSEWLLLPIITYALLVIFFWTKRNIPKTMLLLLLCVIGMTSLFHILRLSEVGFSFVPSNLPDKLKEPPDTFLMRLMATGVFTAIIWGICDVTGVFLRTLRSFIRDTD